MPSGGRQVVTLAEASGKPGPARGYVEGRSVEDLSKRTAQSRTWDNPDGSFTTRVSSDARFYDTGRGFEPIDNTLILEGPTGSFRNKANSFVARFGRSSAVELETPEGIIKMSPLGGSEVQPTVDAKGESVTYHDVWPGVDVR